MARQRRGRGGQRTPRDPAPVSGPGKLGRRTDGGPSAAPPVSDAPVARHGEGPVTEAIEQAGPGARGPAAGGGGRPGGGGVAVPPSIGDPFAPSDDPAADPFEQPSRPDPAAQRRQSDQFLDTMMIGPALPVMEAVASRPNSSQATRNIVRRMRSQLPPEFDMADVFSHIQASMREDDTSDATTARGERSPDA